MDHSFPSESWLHAFADILNSDETYAKTASKWEGDFLFIIEPDEGDKDQATRLYMDLWHGECRSWSFHLPGEGEAPSASFALRASRSRFIDVLSGKVDPVQALLTRRLHLEGSMAYVTRHIPTVLEFVRCARQVGIAA